MSEERGLYRFTKRQGWCRAFQYKMPAARSSIAVIDDRPTKRQRVLPERPRSRSRSPLSATSSESPTIVVRPSPPPSKVSTPVASPKKPPTPPAHPPAHPPSPSSEESTTSILKEKPQPSPTSPPTPAPAGVVAVQREEKPPPPQNRNNGLVRLQAELYQSVVVGRGPEGNRFIPRDAVNRIMQFMPVLGAIRVCLPDLNDELAEYWAARICGDRDLLGLGERPTPAIKLFATLVLCGKGSEIVHLLQEGLTDRDLPLQADVRTGRLLKRLPEKRRHGRSLVWAATSDVESFRRWDVGAKSRFYDVQSLVIAPFFRKGSLWGGMLRETEQMPVIESDVAHRTTDVAHIWRVKFHPAHHNLCRRTASVSHFNVAFVWDCN